MRYARDMSPSSRPRCRALATLPTPANGSTASPRVRAVRATLLQFAADRWTSLALLARRGLRGGTDRGHLAAPPLAKARSVAPATRSVARPLAVPAATGPARQSHTFAAGLALVALLAACSGDTATTAPPDMLTLGILRAVQSAEPQNVEIFLAELAGAGFVEGDNLRIIGGDPTEVHADPAEAESVVRAWARDGLDLVLALSSSGAMAAARAAPEAKVLFLSNDPTAAGLVANERRPEGQLTGATFRVPPDRTLDVARRAVPGATAVGVLFPSTDPAAAPVRDGLVRAGASLGLEVVAHGFAAATDVSGAVEELKGLGVGYVLLANAPAIVRAYPAIAPALAAARLPAVANTTADFALAVLEPDTGELYRQMGRQAVRLLRGTPVSEVPVEDPARFRLTINLAVSERLGVAVPGEVVSIADAVVRP